MARKNKNTRKTALDYAKSGGSQVAMAATFQTGGGSHGGTVRQKHRRNRKAVKQSLRAGFDFC